MIALEIRFVRADRLQGVGSGCSGDSRGSVWHSRTANIGFSVSFLVQSSRLVLVLAPPTQVRPSGRGAHDGCCQGDQVPFSPELHPAGVPSPV